MTTQEYISTEYQDSLLQMLRRSWQCADMDPDNVVLDEEFDINQNSDPENEWPSIEVSIVSIILNKPVGIAVSLTEINISAREEEYNQGFVQMAKAYRNEKEGIFIEYNSSVSSYLCTEIINFYSAKTGKLLGTSRVHYGI